MTGSARELLDAVQAELAPRDEDNRLVPLIVEGRAPRAVFAAIAAEEHRIVRSDWRSFLLLASRAEEQTAREFFGGLAAGEGLALGKLAGLAAATGLDEDALRDYEPRAGCQAYPAYFAWLALNGEAAEVIVALIANFAAWGRYCAAIATAMRARYGFDDEACGFFDFFATPVPEVEAQAVTAVQVALDAGRLDVREARTYARLFQSYELSFWNTLASPHPASQLSQSGDIGSKMTASEVTE
ncbi:transcriptional regulator [Amycolatopsis sp. H20-H5]|uniref:transcriptional regulator n=1 Tax=Amycolatopsis sp. H20-H5 TaxID=3046309 RepID=UPI002DB56C5E|nr:transcriptional regulator [Amycolatopsis sp. H20-H5]MEC3978385.1 transcriptional regulator [Amycolatopsis sp. H20-H5]